VCPEQAVKDDGPYQMLEGTRYIGVISQEKKAARFKNDDFKLALT